ncbi:hypothetical protein [Spiroplasma endosymbiont of Polydrusus pterygomalis]
MRKIFYLINNKAINIKSEKDRTCFVNSYCAIITDNGDIYIVTSTAKIGR